MDLINVQKYDYPTSTRAIHKGSRHYTIADVLQGQPLPSVTSILSATQDSDKAAGLQRWRCLLYTSPSPRDLSTSRMPSSA